MTETKATYKARGRKKVDKYDRPLLRIAATPEEKQLILDSLTTRERAELLLACVELKRLAKVESREVVKEAWDTAGEILYRLYGKDETP